MNKSNWPSTLNSAYVPPEFSRIIVGNSDGQKINFPIPQQLSRHPNPSPGESPTLRLCVNNWFDRFSVDLSSLNDCECLSFVWTKSGKFCFQGGEFPKRMN